MEESIKRATRYSPLVLAYLSGAIYKLYIREYILGRGNQLVNCMYGQTVHYVEAETQARLTRYLEPGLTGEESSVFRRGWNAYMNTMARNASMIDYRFATAFETLVGYWWLDGKEERSRDLMRAGLETLKQEERQTHERKRN